MTHVLRANVCAAILAASWIAAPQARAQDDPNGGLAVPEVANGLRGFLNLNGKLAHVAVLAPG